MATDPNLHKDIAELGKEIHGLTERFSAKEELAEKAADLAAETKRIADKDRIFVIVVAVVMLIVVLASGAAVAVGYSVATCQGEFNKAGELRTALLTEYTVSRDAAMKGLVEARGLPNDPTIIAARDRWLMADEQLAEARRLNPVPRYEDYCGYIPGVPDPKVPAAKEPTPAP